MAIKIQTTPKLNMRGSPLKKPKPKKMIPIAVNDSVLVKNFIKICYGPLNVMQINLKNTSKNLQQNYEKLKWIKL